MYIKSREGYRVRLTLVRPPCLRCGVLDLVAGAIVAAVTIESIPCGCTVRIPQQCLGIDLRAGAQQEACNICGAAHWQASVVGCHEHSLTTGALAMCLDRRRNHQKYDAMLLAFCKGEWRRLNREQYCNIFVVRHREMRGFCARWLLYIIHSCLPLETCPCVAFIRGVLGWRDEIEILTPAFILVSVLLRPMSSPYSMPYLSSAVPCSAQYCITTTRAEDLCRHQSGAPLAAVVHLVYASTRTSSKWDCSLMMPHRDQMQGAMPQEQREAGPDQSLPRASLPHPLLRHKMILRHHSQIMALLGHMRYASRPLQ